MKAFFNNCHVYITVLFKFSASCDNDKLEKMSDFCKYIKRFQEKRFMGKTQI